MSRTAAASRPLTALANATLYLLSLAAVGTAGLAWHPRAGTTRGLVLAAGVLAVALLVGEATRAGRWRWSERLRGLGIVLMVLCAALALLAVIALFGPPSRSWLERAVLGFGAAQAGHLAVAGAGWSRARPVANALLLTLIATLAGGVTAVLAAAGFGSLLAAFLVFEHHARLLERHGCAETGVTRLAVAAALKRAVPLAAGLALAFALWPPTPLAGVRADAPSPDLDRASLAEAQARLALVGIVGAALVYVADRLLRRRKRRPAPTVERLAAERGLEEPLPEPARRRPVPGSGERQRIVRAYASFLRAAVAGGLAREPASTPRELQAKVRAAPGPVGTLTRLFMDARYGRREPSSAEARSAELASEAAAASLGPQASAH